MKTVPMILIMVLLGSFGCSSSISNTNQRDNKASTQITCQDKINNTPVTLRGLTFIDMYGPKVNEYPLLCSGFGYHPGGSEFVFKAPGKPVEYHAVFPKGLIPPKKEQLENQRFILHGAFVTIRQKPDGQSIEKPNKPVKGNLYGYQYFLVSSWEIDS